MRNFLPSICDVLRTSAVVLIRHSTCGRENSGSERSLFDLYYSSRILPLLLVLMLLVDLLRSQVSVRVCIRVAHIVALDNEAAALTPHAQSMRVSVISQSYRHLIAYLNSFLFRL